MRKSFSRRYLFRLLTLALIYPLGLLADPAEVPGKSGVRWYKGNTHTHTLNSDGDSSPGEVAHWYRDHGYDFLVLSDHNYLTQIEELQREFDRETEREKGSAFLLIPGEEVSDQYIRESDNRRYVVHINAIANTRVVDPQGGASVRDVLQRNIDAIHAADGFPHVNHPNYYWSITADDLYSVTRLSHFEIFNGHPQVHDWGGGGFPSLEELWDALLSRGRIYYGIAVDDAHSFQKWGPDYSNPGRAWVMVRSEELSRASILAALKAGDFYASTGVEFLELEAGGGRLSLRIRQRAEASEKWGLLNEFKYRTTFVGKDGRILKIDESMTPSYELQPGDLYVRARVDSSEGASAWTQALFAPGKGQAY